MNTSVITPEAIIEMTDILLFYVFLFVLLGISENMRHVHNFFGFAQASLLEVGRRGDTILTGTRLESAWAQIIVASKAMVY